MLRRVSASSHSTLPLVVWVMGKGDDRGPILPRPGGGDRNTRMPAARSRRRLSGLCCDRAPDGQRAAEMWFEARVARIRLGTERVERLAEEAARGGCHNHVEYVRVREPEFAQVRDV